MNLKRASIILFSLFCVLSSAPAPCERTMYLNLCQEIVNSARSYEARATFHARVAKNVQMQIETMAKLPKDQAQSTAIDNLFTQYDENRVLESKYRELYRQTSDEAKQCMKTAE
jgi:hypothetical protein